MKAITATYIGGEDTGDTATSTWGTGLTGQITFELNKPLRLDPAESGPLDRRFIEHIIRKVQRSPHYKIVEAKDAEPAKVTKPKAKAKDAEPAGDE